MVIFEGLKRKAPAEKLLYIVVSIIFGAVCFSYLYILFWMIMSGAKTHPEVVIAPFALPEKWNWKNYIDVFSVLEVNGSNFFKMLFNSLWFSVFPTLTTSWAESTFAYTCEKYTFPTSRWPYFIILFVLTLPVYGSGGAAYRFNYKLGFVNNYIAAFTNWGAFTMHYLYYQAFFKNMSWSYAEAAQIDGANDFQIYYKIMLPLSMPIVSALGLLSWMGKWNTYADMLVYHPKLPTLPVGIYQFNYEMTYRARLDILFAACFLVCIPCLILFICFNKLLTTNISVGGIKG